jgi:hypothetical protein
MVDGFSWSWEAHRSSSVIIHHDGRVDVRLRCDKKPRTTTPHRSSVFHFSACTSHDVQTAETLSCVQRSRSRYNCPNGRRQWSRLITCRFASGAKARINHRLKDRWGLPVILWYSCRSQPVLCQLGNLGGILTGQILWCFIFSSLARNKREQTFS